MLDNKRKRMLDALRSQLKKDSSAEKEQAKVKAEAEESQGETDVSTLKETSGETEMKPLAEAIDEADGEDTPSEPIPEPDIKITVTPDKMNAYIKVTAYDPDQEVSPEKVMALLVEQKIVYGIDRKELEDYCRLKRFYTEAKIASGTRPVRGEDGNIITHFTINRDKAPKDLGDGKVDYKNFNIITNTNKGELLCTIVYATPGVEGTNIMGAPVKAIPGKNPKVPSGKNITLSEDKCSIYAAADGEIQFAGDKLWIEENYTIRGDVGPVTGNVNFNGNVVVNGNVLEGFIIKAGKSIIVRGYVEGATLLAKEKILITYGYNGMNKGLLQSGGDITTKYVENGTVECGGVFRSDVAMHSTVKARDSIIIKTGKGIILSGTYVAANMICAKNIGTDVQNRTDLIIARNWYEKEKAENEKEKGKEKTAEKAKKLPPVTKEELQGRIAQLENQLEQTNATLESLKLPDPSMDPAKRRMTTVRMVKLKSQLSGQIATLGKELAEMETRETMETQKVVCTGSIYPGGKITIEYATIKIGQTFFNQKFVLNDGQLTTAPVLPNESAIQ